jgi:hypothetical protein
MIPLEDTVESVGIGPFPPPSANTVTDVVPTKAPLINVTANNPARIKRPQFLLRSITYLQRWLFIACWK